jgi:hypothetical protein
MDLSAPTVPNFDLVMIAVIGAMGRTGNGTVGSGIISRDELISQALTAMSYRWELVEGIKRITPFQPRYAHHVVLILNGVCASVGFVS